MGSARGRAEQATELMLVDRSGAEAEAVALLEREIDDATRAMALRVLGFVSLHRGAMGDAMTYCNESLAAAERAGEDVLIGRALMTRMGVLISTDQAQRAVEDAERAEALLPPADRVRVLIQQATAVGLGLKQANRAIALYDRVEAEFAPLEPIVETILRMNRGTQLADSGDHRRAIDDFGFARRMYREMGNAEAEADVVIHQANAAARLGDFPTVFALHAEVSERALLVGQDPRYYNDLGEALQAAGLRREAAAMARAALEASDVEHITVGACESGLRLASIALADGDLEMAQRTVDRVRAWSSGSEFGWLATRAEALGWEIAVERDGPSSEVAEAMGELADRLAKLGHTAEAADVTATAARHALDVGDDSLARRLLVSVPYPEQADGPIETARARHTAALRCLADGDERAALRHLAWGIDALDRMRAGIGSLEVRASATDRAPEMAELGIRITASRSRPRRLLEWSERQRASAIRLVAPSQERIDRASRQLADVATVSADEIVSRVGARTLIQFLQVGSELHSLTISHGRVRHHRALAEWEEVERLGRQLEGGLRTMTRLDAGAGAALVPASAASAARLGALLLGHLPNSDDHIVIVPTGSLHLLAWGALPQLHARPWSVAPSAQTWLAADLRPHRAGKEGVSAVFGPELPFAADEVLSVRTDVGQRLSPSTSAETLAAIDGASIGHIAAHGRFRNDNAHLSYLEMAGGPLYVHDLESVANIPPVLVLSACDIGAVGLLRGDEVLGFPAVALASGVRTLVASLLPVEDGAARDLMVEFHRRLRSGEPPGRALAAANAELRDRSPHHHAAASSFVCFGAG